MQPLQRPAAGDESRGEILEQLGMRRRQTLDAEVAGRAHQVFVEMPAQTRSRSRARSAKRHGEDFVAELRRPEPLWKSEGLRKDQRKPARRHVAGTREVAAAIEREIARHARLRIEESQVGLGIVPPHTRVVDEFRNAAFGSIFFRGPPPPPAFRARSPFGTRSAGSVFLRRGSGVSLG